MLNKYLSYIQESSNNVRLFHISNNIIKVLMPRIPDNFYTKKGWEDSTIKRASVAPDIDHCILSIGNNKITNNPKIYMVYEPTDYSKIKVMSNAEIIRRGGLVPDADVTKEYWLLTPTKVKEIAKIKVLKMTNRYEIVPYGPEGKHTEEKYRRAFYWEWKVIEGKI